MNECDFIGNFTTDPILQKMHDDKISVLNFRIAVHRKFKSGAGELKKETSFLDMEAFDSGAETIVRNFRKGDTIFIKACARNIPQSSKIKFRVNSFYPITRKASNDVAQ